MRILTVTFLYMLSLFSASVAKNTSTTLGKIITIDGTYEEPYEKISSFYYRHIWAAFEHGLKVYDPFVNSGFPPGRLVRIADIDTPDVVNMSVRDSTVYVICSNGIYWYEPYIGNAWDSSATWDSMPGAGIIDCAVDSLKNIWFITDDSVFTYTPKNKLIKYDQVDLQRCQSIQVDSYNDIWFSYRSVGENYSQICRIPSGSKKIVYYPNILLDTSGAFSTCYLPNLQEEKTVLAIDNERKLLEFSRTTLQWTTTIQDIIPDTVTINAMSTFYWGISIHAIAVATSNGIYWGFGHRPFTYHKMEYANCISVINAYCTNVTAYAASEGGVSFEVLDPCVEIYPNNNAIPTPKPLTISSAKNGTGILFNLLGQAINTKASQGNLLIPA